MVPSIGLRMASAPEADTTKLRLWPTNSGKQEVVRPGHPKKIGFVPRQSFGLAISNADRGLQISGRRGQCRIKLLGLYN